MEERTSSRPRCVVEYSPCYRVSDVWPLWTRTYSATTDMRHGHGPALGRRRRLSDQQTTICDRSTLYQCLPHLRKPALHVN